MEFCFAIVFNNVNDIMFLIMKLERHTKLNINVNKDENGKYDVNNIILTFSDDQINNILADYLNLKDGMINNSTTNMTLYYDTVINDLMINIEKIN